MKTSSTTPRRQTASGAGFRTTHWSVVLEAGREDTPRAREALEQLCQGYWAPLYSFVRRQGASPHDAQDLVQGFFAHLFEQEALATVDRRKGRFRSFLLASLKNFLANERDRASALKRGGQCAFISWDEINAEESYRAAQATGLPPDRAFEQHWATTVLEQTLGKLRREYVESSQGALFDALQVYLTGDRGASPYAEMASRLNLGQSAIKMSVQRLRRRFGEALRTEIAHTVSKQEEIDEEIRCLFAAVRC